jgi:formamidopyrimidine-DNA glycosylase
MPELPEVETIRRTLIPSVKGKSFAEVEVFNPSVLENVSKEDFVALKGASIDDIGRRGKYLIFDLSKDKERYQMVAHMRMTGKLLYANSCRPLAKHTHLRFLFSDGSELQFEDTRRFGRFWLVGYGKLNEVGGLNSLALEPLDADFNVLYWEEKIKNRSRSLVKSTLLDQHVVAGLGNIYADEVLFAAGVNGARPTGSLTHAENERLVLAMREILELGIEKCGTTFSDYVDSNNHKGDMQSYLKVFLHEGDPCPNCGSKILKTKIGGRSSYFCPHCQTK